MKREYLLVSLFFLIAAGIIYLFYEIIIPFFVPICWAGVFAIIFFPLYQRVLKRVKRRGLASLIICVLIILIIIGPITYLFVALVNEAANAVAEINELYRSGQLDELLSFQVPGFEVIKEKLAPYYDVSKINLDEIIKDAVNRVSQVLISQTTWLVTNGTRAVFYFGLMIFAMYYFFKDGELLVNKMKRLMPLKPQQVDLAFKQLHDVIQATMYGGVLIALLQGLLGGITFWIFGISSPVFWGAIMAFLSLLPFVGAFLVFVPAGVILILGGSYVQGLLVIAIGVAVISQVDNLLRPYFISGQTQMHPLMLFFTIMGGISLFGLLGLVLGPMIAAAFTILLRVLEMRLHPSDDIPAEVSEEV